MPDISLPIAEIRTDGGTQPRAKIDAATVAEYAEDMTEGATFPAVTVFYDGSYYWLADGFHRMAGAQQIGLVEIGCDVRQGKRRDAQWFSFGANKTHGIRRAPGDPKRAIESILADDEWRQKPQTEIAIHVGVTQGYVSMIFTSYKTNKIDRSEVIVTRGDSTYTMHTANIGQRASAPADPAPAAANPDEGSTLPEPKRESAPVSSPPAKRTEYKLDFYTDLIGRMLDKARCPVDERFITAVQAVLTEAVRDGRITINY